jgi:hypothetical protein
MLEMTTLNYSSSLKLEAGRSRQGQGSREKEAEQTFLTYLRDARRKNQIGDEAFKSLVQIVLYARLKREVDSRYTSKLSQLEEKLNKCLQTVWTCHD